MMKFDNVRIKSVQHVTNEAHSLIKDFEFKMQELAVKQKQEKNQYDLQAIKVLQGKIFQKIKDAPLFKKLYPPKKDAKGSNNKVTKPKRKKPTKLSNNA